MFGVKVDLNLTPWTNSAILPGTCDDKASEAT